MKKVIPLAVVVFAAIFALHHARSGSSPEELYLYLAAQAFCQAEREARQIDSKPGDLFQAIYLPESTRDCTERMIQRSK